MPDQARPVRLIALMNQKGGVGKTTTTVNLAAAIARAGRPTLVVDLDPQAHASLHLGVDPATVERSVYDLLLDDEADPAGVIRPVSENLAILPSATDLAAAESELASLPDRDKRLEKVLDKLNGAYEFILFDCPPSLGLLTINALAAAREVLIPMQAHFLALQGVGKLLETVSLVSKAVNPRLKVLGVVLCMHDASSTHTREVVADLDAFFDQGRAEGADPLSPWRFARVFRPAIRRSIKLAECPSFGRTIFDYEPKSAGAEDYAGLAGVILAEWDAMLARRSDAAPRPEPAEVTVMASAPRPVPTQETPA